MSAPSLSRDPDELAQLRAEVAALRGELHRHPTPAAPRSRRRLPRHHLPRRFLPLALVILLVALTPLSILAATPIFSDLGTAAPVHQPNIQAIAAAGITTGFPDPNATNPDIRLYDPKGTVTREEMASFLARTAGLGTNPPVANAKTAQTATLATNATNATSATQLNGQPASFYQPAGQPIANATAARNADKVGGYAPNGLVRVARTLVPNNPYASPTPQPVTDITADYPAWQQIGTVALTAPADGFVLVMAQTIAGSKNTQSVALRLRDPLSGETSPLVGSQSQNGDGLQTTVTPIHVFPVAAGARTFILEASSPPGGLAGESQVADTTISALYMPFGSTGGSAFETGQPAPAGAPAPGPLPIVGK